jgi:DNA repair protein RadA/Sms
MGCILSAASCNKWFVEDILGTRDFANEEKNLDALLGENGTYFLPYLMGERSPHNDVDARGAFIGMRPDTTREHMVLAVLEARCGLNLSSQDVYLNIAGGLRISEPAADLAVALAVISSLSNKPLPADMVVFGEIGLSGEIRGVSQPSLRLKEAKKLGFNSAILPQSRSTDKKFSVDISLHEIGNVQRLINLFN